MPKTDSIRTQRRPCRVNAEGEAGTAHARLKALGVLFECAQGDESRLDRDDMFAIGDLIREEAGRAYAAFYELWDATKDKKATPEVPHGNA